MNTFLLSNDHEQTARCLDSERLNRCLCDCIGIAKLLILYDIARERFNRQIPFGIVFSPVIRLWMLDEDTILLPELQDYYLTLNREWRKLRGKDHKTTTTFNWQSLFEMNGWTMESVRMGDRPWKLEWPIAVYHSHRARLLKKDPTHYGYSLVREGLSETGGMEGHYSSANPIVRL